MSYASIFTNQAKAKQLASASRIASASYQAELLAFHAKYKQIPRNKRYSLPDYPKRVNGVSELSSVMGELKQDLMRVGFTLNQARTFLSL